MTSQLQETEKSLRIKYDEAEILMLELKPVRNKIRMLEVRLKSKDEEWREQLMDVQNKFNYFRAKYKTVQKCNTKL